MVAAPGMLLSAGKKLEGACAARAVPARFTYLRDSRAIVTRPSIWLSRRKGLQLLSSFLYYFSLSSLDRPSMGAEVGRFERFVFLFLALFCQAFCFCFWDSNFLEFFKLIDSY